MSPYVSELILHKKLTGNIVIVRTYRTNVLIWYTIVIHSVNTLSV